MDIHNLTGTLHYSLSRPPAVAGKRLRSERELAKIFNVGEAQIRKVLSRLVNEGVLVRRRGSGTFVRRIVEYSTTRQNDLSPEMLKKASLVFTDSRPSGNFSTSRPQASQLHIGLWGDLGNNCLVDQFIIGSIAKAASSAGHRLTVHNIIEDFQTWNHISVESFRRQLEAHPCDGYLVVNSISDLFIEAVGDNQVPVMFFLGGTVEIEHEPLVFFDTAEALKRAIRKFYSLGHKKIAFIGEKRKQDEPEDLINLEVRAYEDCMKKLGLDYRAYELSSTGVAQAMESTRNLFRKTDAPEALYVADDNVLVGVAEALSIEGIVPGKDVALITLSNRNFPLPPGRDWSCMEFDRERYAQLLVDNLLYQLQSTGTRANTLAVHANWVAGQTHEIKKGKGSIAIVENVEPGSKRKNVKSASRFAEVQ